MTSGTPKGEGPTRSEAASVSEYATGQATLRLGDGHYAARPRTQQHTARPHTMPTAHALPA